MTGEAEAKRLRTRTEDRIVALLAERDNLQAESDIIQARLSSIAAELRQKTPVDSPPPAT